MKIAIGSDHAGFELKEELKKFLSSLCDELVDFGCKSSDSCDYPDFAVPLAKSVSAGEFDFGILICGSGIGMSIAANKVKGIRAANCCSPQMAQLARQHNDANILTLGARLISFDLAKEIISTFLTENFQGGRHIPRIQKIHNSTGL
ncbi:MAG: ribose 5-phosphate isomerase B [Candidatus Kapaibacteriales bacterium]